MTSNSDRHGQSGNTPYKQQSLRAYLLFHMKLVRSIVKRPKWYWHNLPYLYFGLHGGKGRDDNGHMGSPLIFNDVASQSKLSYCAHIYEKNPVNFKALQANLAGLPHISIYNEDHNNLLGRLPDKPVRWQFGSVYCDPTDVNIPLDLLQSIVTAYPALEVVINISATNYKRVSRLPEWKRLNTVLYSLKHTWHIRKPIAAHQWTLLIGTDWENMPAWEKYDFANIDTPLGAEWFEKIIYTIQERMEQRQSGLFESKKKGQRLGHTAPTQNT